MESHYLLFLFLIATVSFALSAYGSAVGLVLGHLRLPLLVYCLPSTTVGMATNLAISGLGALSGSLQHLRNGRVSWKLLAFMGLPSVVGAALGAVAVAQVDGRWARIGIGGFLLLTGVSMLPRRGSATESATESAESEPKQIAKPLHPMHSLYPMHQVRLVFEVLLGLALGFLASLTGLMLGSLRLPVMIRLLRIDPTIAIGTNMGIGCLTALGGAISLWPHNEALPVWPLLIVVPPTILGGYLGARLTGWLPKNVLCYLVGLTIVLAGMIMFVEGIYRVSTS